MKIIKKIKLSNFKRFKDFSVEFDNSLNLLIGDNEAGKSTILSAIDIVLSGSRSKVETVGLENLFNVDVISDFLDSEKNYSDLPKLYVEIFLNDQGDYRFNGQAHSEDGITADGIRLICEPNNDHSEDISRILDQADRNFPFEFYTISFKTFAGESYSGYSKPLKHLLLDSSQINNEHATRQYIKTLYQSKVEAGQKNKHHNEYRKHKERFSEIHLNGITDTEDNYSFSLKNNSKANLQTDLTISEGNIAIENKGKGRQCFIKTEFALSGNEGSLDVILLEEPENHLSHINMSRLVNRISESENKQLFVATHNNLISTRLDLRRSIFLNSNTADKVLLKDLEEDTAKFFMKAPDNNILEFILSERVILVEGNAEYMLMQHFFESVAGATPHEKGVHIISVGGKSFKRYLELAKKLGIRTAVVTDNDRNYQANCIDGYSEYIDNNIKIFFDTDNERWTFEVVLYRDNQEVCDSLFSEGRRLPIEEYMLKNKAEVSFQLLDKKASELVTPAYISQAIQWINE